MLLFMQLPNRNALIWSVLGGYLLLPSATRFDLKGFPDLDKSSMIAIGVGLGSLMFTRRSVRSGGAGLVYVLGPILVLSPFVTAYLNPDPIVGTRLFFPGLTLYDGLSQAGVSLFLLVPFWAGRRLLADEAGHKAIVDATLVAMLCYSLLVLLEIRLSPQLHNWVYGFFPHSFAQQYRAGGFRAVVFLSHGLVVAMFLGLGFLAAIGRQRFGARLLGVRHVWWVLYLLIVLLLQKSLGAAAIGLVLGAAMAMLPGRRTIGLAAIIALIVSVYPIVRGSGVLPVQTIENVTAKLSIDRASSLNTRLVNEDLLLTKASQRPIFGWGAWGRNRVYDLEQGVDLSITDGTWIAVLGTHGWVGYLAMFGLLSLPAFRLFWVFRKGRRIPPATPTVAMLLIFNLIDLIPNSSLNPFTWLLAGALLIRAQPPGAASPAGGRGDDRPIDMDRPWDDLAPREGEAA